VDNLAVMAESKEELIKKFNRWKDAVEDKGMKVNTNKTKVMISGESRKGYRILERGYVVFVVEMLVETRYTVQQYSQKLVNKKCSERVA